MKFMSKAKDGGAESTVTGYWLVEIKSLFSVVLLRFDKGSRDAYHSHAFHALTWFLKGCVTEHVIVSPGHLQDRVWKPSLRPKWTPRSCFHKVFAKETTWALSFRGPWKKTWHEYLPSTDTLRTLTHGRRIVP